MSNVDIDSTQCRVTSEKKGVHILPKIFTITFVFYATMKKLKQILTQNMFCLLWTLSIQQSKNCFLRIFWGSKWTKSVLVAHFFNFFIIVERDKCYGEEDFFSNQTLVQGTQTPISNTNVAAYYGNQYADTTICSMCFCCCLFHPNVCNKRRSGYLSIYHF